MVDPARGFGALLCGLLLVTAVGCSTSLVSQTRNSQTRAVTGNLAVMPFYPKLTATSRRGPG